MLFLHSLYPVQTDEGFTGWVNVVHRIKVELYDDTKTAMLPATDPPSKKEEAHPHSPDPEIATQLNSLAVRLAQRYRHTMSIGDLIRAIELAQRAIEASPIRHPNRPFILTNLGCWLSRRYDLTRSVEDLTIGIKAAEQAVTLTPDNHPSLATRLGTLGYWLDRRYERTKLMDHLTRSIEVRELTVGLTPIDHPNIVGYLNDLAVDLRERYDRTHSVEDLTRAIGIYQKAVKTTSDNAPELAAILHNLGNSLGVRYRETRRVKDLAGAIETIERAIKALPSKHPNLPEYLSNLGAWLCLRFQATSVIDDLERGIVVTQRAIDATSDTDNISLAKYLCNLGSLLGHRSGLEKTSGDLNKAIELTTRAIAIMPSNHPNLNTARNNLAEWLSCRSDEIDSTDTLTRAIEVCHKAVEASGDNDPNLAMYLGSLGHALSKRSEQTGSRDDLTKAIEAIQKAVGVKSNGLQDLSSLFSLLSSYLGKRYELIGLSDDLTGAIEAAERAIEATPDDDITFPGKSVILANQLARRHERTGSADDLTIAIEWFEKAVKMTPDTHTDLARRMSDLSMVLGTRYRLTGALNDLDRAIILSRKAVTISAPADLATSLSTLGNMLKERYQRTGSMDDLMDAIQASKDAVEARAKRHEYLCNDLTNLGNLLKYRYAQTGEKSDQDAQLSAFVKGWHCTTSRPIDRMRSAKFAADIYASRTEWDRAYDLLREAVRLLPKISPRSLGQSDMQNRLTLIANLATYTASVALNSGKPISEVLSILELGRGVIAGLLIETRSDLSDLRKIYPTLANGFDALREELDSPLHNYGPSAELSMVNRRHQASRELEEFIDRIRAQDGFHDFLQPPPADTLMLAAESGPVVVINFSQYRCDAILIERHTIRLLQLPGLISDEVVEYATKVSGFKYNPWPLLEWLWATLCRPCLDALGFTEPVNNGRWPHVWWVPTGPFSLLPLHAAGVYTPESKETVLDRVVSSYASSLKALQHGRRQRGGIINGQAQQDDAILVAMEQTEGQTSLPNAKTETDQVRALCPSLHLNATTPPRLKGDILEHLRKCKVLHFAGHGKSHRDPSQSCLLLDDWKTNPLTVNDLRKSWLQDSPAFLAYLSACSTGSNQAWGLADEAIHLVSAFQLAGFRHVVGTMWEVSDPHCVDVATVLYQTLCEEGMTDEAVSYGLHRAIRKLRDDSFRDGGKRDIVLVGEDEGPAPGSSVNTFWIPYIHYGA